jgi:hypothetical protein
MGLPRSAPEPSRTVECQRLEVDLRLAFFAVFLLAFLVDFTGFSLPTNPLTLFSKSLNARESAA